MLRKTSMPSILVELGYISNPAEERFMRTKEGQNKLATAIYNAFTKYKWEYDRKRGALAGNASAAPILRLQIILMIINRFLRLLEAKSIFAKRTRWRSPTRVACPSRQSPRSKRSG